MGLPKPLGKQREVLYMPAIGHSVVLGTAGSGKTTLGIYRAAYLSSPDMPHSGPTLFLTFNQALVTYLKHITPAKFKNLVVESYHKFARGYLNSRGKMAPNAICEPEVKRALIATAVTEVSKIYPKNAFFDRPTDFFVDEIQWIHCYGISSKEEYVKIERVGRIGSNLARKLRGMMYDILERYRFLRDQSNKLYDWDDIATSVKREFLADTGARCYRHIVIDEGQDFSPEMIRSLAAAIPENGSLTFFGDVAQQIYGPRTTWRDAGLTVPKIWEFEENYRNTKQIAGLSNAISKMPYFDGISDKVTPKFPRADGPLPTLAKCADRDQQLKIALRLARAESKTRSVAILFKNRAQERLLHPHLPTSAVKLHRNMRTWREGAGISYGTYHSSKGLEFEVVILPFLDADNIPDSGHIASYGEEDALTHDGALLYVAVTRARTELLLLHSNTVTPLLPVDETLYQKVSL